MLRHSNSAEQNPDVKDVTDTYAEEDNTRFFAEATDQLGGPRALIGLVGACDLPGVALRRAQSILRWDRRPSLWSHAFLVVDDGIREVTLHSRAGHFPEPADNAITPGTLDLYERDPNVALLKVSMSDEEAAAVAHRAVKEPNLERLRYDLFEALGFWQAYLWTRGTANPLEQGIPMAASALIEYCFEAIQLDLTPGANDRNSAPEHLWNGARWWTDAFGEFGRKIEGRAVIRDRHCRVLGPGETTWK
ncbi:hypothetical protein DVA67_027020 [Solirubrobacter sp. CPCC 204708]|uniref:Uncharacterized protein n=1 Tax=Solirubrobacter deserti TaxID=2282478 RepID=A0ABT4RGD1_9ACTN|nr:hypothetical protein [Solirubrobacter deserti]MBE2319650.1 hypothetical protein [Solirubrobacter deserti]MDA0137611.1 hypothetical protein [Solirubrobacter deserti]